MELKEHLVILAKRESSKLGNILAAYEVKRWPAGRLDKLIEMGMLISIPDAITIKCPCCSRGCPVEPVKGVENDGTEFCEVLCDKEGSNDVDPFYLKQWQITEKIRKYLPKTKQKKEKGTKHASGQLDAEVKNRLAGNPNATSTTLAKDIGNTSAKSIRQTKAWINRKKKQKK